MNLLLTLAVEKYLTLRAKKKSWSLIKCGCFFML